MAIAAVAAVSCDDDDVFVGQVDSGRLDVPEGNVVYVTDAKGNRKFSNVEFHTSGTEQLWVNAGSALSKDCNVTFTYDPSVLDEYNRVNNTSYKALPQSVVQFANGGTVTLPAGQKAASVEYTLTSDGTLSPDEAYALPVRATVNGGAQLGQTDATRVILVRDLTSLPNCTKYVLDENGNEVPGVKIFSCMEVNDTNPLNNLSFTLKSNGKPLVDALIIFSANINYNPETGRVYIFNNDNVQALLDNRAKYLKPLKDRGMKIILGILGNHDRSGIANLDNNTAKLFAQECKAMCDAYDLDGIFVDDEYSAYQYPVPPGFVSPSQEAASRLVYEIKKAQPERLTVAYCYSRTYGLNDVTDLETGEVVKAGEYTDYALHDYGGSSDLASSFNGMQRSQMGLYSQEFNLGRFASLSNLKRMRENGYGAHMIFAMDPNRSNAWNQENAMNNCAQAFYDDEVVFDGIKYPKDWK